MDAILSFSLLLIQNFSQPEFKKYDCNVQIYSEIFPETTRSMFVIMKEIVEMPIKRELSRNHTIVALRCSGAQGPMKVHLLVSEKMHRGKAKGTYLLQSLTLNADPEEEDCAAKCCFVSEDHKRNSQRPAEIRLTGKVFLPGVLNCSISSNQSKNSILASKEQIMNESCTEQIRGKSDLEYRRKRSMHIKIGILCIMFPAVLGIIVFGVCEVPLPAWFSCENNRKEGEKYKVGNEKKEDLTSETPGPSNTEMV
ncbi:uncharacterized protein C17orf78 homolog [Heteronotia binoei]|uniref:uncharacterized protein C17orf78 homolog n=1 Tax=Heteronotia binoei TaxID=13085 RepID=UPI002930499F|nr:uncharacterized protein C17orf78 homolog [Heteronotia binoei]